MRIIGFVPVRIGSKSIPKKNIKDWNGKPLLYWVCNALNSSNKIDEFYLASDSQEIDEIFLSFNFKKGLLYKRDRENALDESSSESVLLEFLNKNKFELDDVICFCQATSPYLTSIDIDEAIKGLNNYSSIISVTKFERFIWSSNNKPINYDPFDRPRRQEINNFYLENGAIYISPIKSIKHSNCRISGDIGFHIMDDIDSIELDNPVDWEISEKIHKNILVNDKNKIKLFVSDVDGTLTDSGMYYSDEGEYMKKFNTRDGMGFQILRENGILTSIITSETSDIVKSRAEKLMIDYFFMGFRNEGKLNQINKLCSKLNIKLNEVAYIGDDINCFELLNKVGFPACPADACSKVKSIEGIMILKNKGGEGAFREFVDYHFNDS